MCVSERARACRLQAAAACSAVGQQGGWGARHRAARHFVSQPGAGLVLPRSVVASPAVVLLCARTRGEQQQAVLLHQGAPCNRTLPRYPRLLLRAGCLLGVLGRCWALLGLLGPPSAAGGLGGAGWLLLRRQATLPAPATTPPPGPGAGIRGFLPPERRARVARTTAELGAAPTHLVAARRTKVPAAPAPGAPRREQTVYANSLLPIWTLCSRRSANCVPAGDRERAAGRRRWGPAARSTRRARAAELQVDAPAAPGARSRPRLRVSLLHAAHVGERGEPRLGSAGAPGSRRARRAAIAEPPPPDRADARAAPEVRAATWPARPSSPRASASRGSTATSTDGWVPRPASRAAGRCRAAVWGAQAAALVRRDRPRPAPRRSFRRARTMRTARRRRATRPRPGARARSTWRTASPGTRRGWSCLVLGYR